jgi:hypothetical protein
LLVKKEKAKVVKVGYGTITGMFVVKGFDRENQGDFWDLRAMRLGDHFRRRS